MKKLAFFSVLFVFLAVWSWGQVNYFWSNNGSDGVWGNYLNWDIDNLGTPAPQDDFPGSATGDTATIDGAFTVTVYTTILNSLNSLTIQGSANLITNDNLTTINLAIASTAILTGDIALSNGGNTFSINNTNDEVTILSTSGTIGDLNVGGRTVSITTIGGSTITIGAITMAGTIDLVIGGTGSLSSTTTFNTVTINASLNSFTLSVSDKLTIGASGSLTLDALLNILTATVENNGTLTLGAYTLTASSISNTGILSLDGGTNQLALTSALSSIDGTVEFTGNITTMAGLTGFENLTIQNGNRTVGAVTVSGDFELYAAGSLNATSLYVTKTSKINGNIETSGDQEYSGTVTLDVAVLPPITLKGSKVTFGDEISGDFSLKIDGVAEFNGDADIGELEVTGTSFINANITTTGGTQQYEAVELGGSDTLYTLTGTTVTINNTLSGSKSLEIDGAAVLSTVNGLVSLTVTGTATLNANVSTSGNQIFNGTLTLNNGNGTNPKELTSSSGLISHIGNAVVGTLPTTVLTVNALNGIELTTSGITTATLNNNRATNPTGNIKFTNTSTSLILNAINDRDGDIIINQTGTLNINGLQTQLGGAISITSGGAVTQTIGTSIVTGTLTLSGGDSFTLNNTGNNVATLKTNVVLPNTYPTSISYTYTNSNALIIDGLQTSGTIALTAGGAVTQSGAIATGTLTLSGGGSFALNNTGNNVATLKTDIVLPNTYPTSISYTYTNSNALIIDGLQTSGTTGSIALTAGGAVTQSGAITTDTLTLSGNGSFTLDNSGNDVSILQTGATAPSSISYTNTDATNGFEIANLHTNGTSGAITLTSDGAVTQSASTTITTGTITLSGSGPFTFDNPNNDVAILKTGTTNPLSISYTNTDAANGFIIAGLQTSGTSGTITLTSDGAVTQNASTTITTRTLTLSGTGSFTLDNSGNDVTILQTGTTDPLFVSYTNTDATNGLEIADLQTSGTITLTSDGTVTQSATTTITTGTLTLSGSGPFTLDNSGNDVAILKTGTTNPLSISYTNTDAANGFIIAGLQTSGTSGTITLTSDGAVTQSSSTTITTETLTLSGTGPFTLDNSGNDVAILQTGAANPSSISYTNTDNSGFRIASLQTNGTGTITLTSDGAVTQSASTTITTGTLTLSGSGPFTLDNSGNDVAILQTGANAPFPSSISYTDDNDFDIGTRGLRTQDSGSTSIISITAGGAVSQAGTSGAITTGTLILSGNVVFTLNQQNNNVGTIKTDTVNPSSISYTNANELIIGGLQTQINGSISITAGGTGTVTQTDEIITPALTLSGSAEFTLDNEDNEVGIFSITDAGGEIKFTNKGAVIIDGIDSTADVTLKTINSGNITQTGAITAGTLNVNSGGGIILDTINTNNVTTLNITAAAGAVQFKNNAALAIAGVNGVGSNNVTITTTGTGNDITQTGTITTIGMLTVNSGGAIRLNAANSVSTLNVTGAGGVVQFTNNATLSINGISATANGGTTYHNVELTSITGGITINGAINSSTLALYATTAIAGIVDIANTITVTSGTNTSVDDPPHDATAGVYIDADSLTGSGAINLAPYPTGWVCAFIETTVSYTDNVTGNRIHYHSNENKHIVYRTGVDSGSYANISGNYLYIQADLNLGANINLFATGTGNVYIIDVDDGSVTNNPALTRAVNFSAPDGFIEIRGKYTSTLALTLNSGKDIVYFRDNDSNQPTELTLPSLNLTGKTLHLLGGISPNTDSITTTGNITLESITADGDGTNHLTLNSNGRIDINDAVGSSSNRIGDIIVTTAANQYITFYGAVFAESYNQTAGNARILANQNHNNAFSLTNSLDIDSARIVTNNNLAGITVNGTTTIAGDVTLNTQAGNGHISLNTVTGTGNLEMTAGGGAVTVGQVGNTSTSFGNLTVSAGSVAFGADVFAADVLIENSGQYAQNANVTANSFEQTGSGTVSLNGDITVTAATMAAAYIKFASMADFGQPLTFSVPPTGGLIDLTQGIGGTFQLTLNGGSSDTAYLELSKTSGTLGNVEISAGCYIKVSSGKIITQDSGKELTLQTNSVLDTSAGSWYMGTPGTPNSFSGIDGTLMLYTGSTLINNDVNFTGSDFTVNNTGWATITANGSVVIEAAPSFSAFLPQLILEMNGSGLQNPQNLRTEQTLGSLHVGANSNTVLNTNDPSNTIYFRGEVIIYSTAAPLGLDAGNFDIVMYAGLEGNRNFSNYTHNGTDIIMYTRWEITADIINKPPYASLPDMNDFVFRQNPGRKVSFKKDELSANGSRPVFFEIAGNSMWREFECIVSGAVIQFSRHPDHHTVLDKFTIGNQSASAPDHSDYVTITRLTDDYEYSGYPYLYDPNNMTPPKTPAAGGSDSVGTPGQWALPVYYPPLDLKNADQKEQEKYWNINLVSFPETLRPLDDFRYVKIFFSHAYNQRIPIETGSMHLDAIPYYRPATGEGYFNFDWIELRKILYSFTEDASGDGRLDRIRVQANVALNGDFSQFEVKIEGYEVDVSRGANGFQMVSDQTHNNDDDDSFYIYLHQIPQIDTGSTPLWRVTRNLSLKDKITETSSVGDPEIDIDIRPFDTIPPRIAYTLTLPGHPQTYVKMSEPVLSDGGNISDTQAVERSEAYTFTWQYFPFDSDPVNFTLPVIAANMGYLLNMASPVDLETLSRLNNIFGDAPTETDGYFRMDNMLDQGQRAMDWNDPSIDPAFYIYYSPPKYPLDWGYNAYAKVYGNGHLTGRGLLNPDFSADTAAADADGNSVSIADVFLPPHKMLTVEMMTLIAQGRGDEVTPESFASYLTPSAPNSVIRRITDVLISTAPGANDSNNYFAWPVWARYSELANPDNASVSGDFWSQRTTDNGLIWVFDGTAFLEARGIDLQVRMNSRLAGSLELFWLTDIDSKYRLPAEDPVRGRNTGGFWLPYPSDLRSNRFLYYFTPRYDGSAISQTDASAPDNSPLFNFAIGGENNSGKKLEFVFRINGDNGSTTSDLFIARLDIPRGAAIPKNWYELVRPFGFDIQDIRLQRGGVTILNNVINSGERENTFIRYHLVRPGRVTVQIYTLDGTLVKSLRRNEYREAGEWTDAWDGTNNSGRSVARGMYFVRVVAPDIDEIRKIMVVR